MDYSSVSGTSGLINFPNRRTATAHAKAAILKSDIQERLGDEAGAFVWKVEKYPNWLQISVDMVGNDEPEERVSQAKVREWFNKEREEQVNEMFKDLLSESFGEIYVTASPMGLNNPNGHCCRTGCGGCINGTKDKLLPKLVGETPTLPTDTYG